MCCACTPRPTVHAIDASLAIGDALEVARFLVRPTEQLQLRDASRYHSQATNHEPRATSHSLSSPFLLTSPAKSVHQCGRPSLDACTSTQDDTFWSCRSACSACLILQPPTIAQYDWPLTRQCGRGFAAWQPVVVRDRVRPRSRLAAASSALISGVRPAWHLPADCTVIITAPQVLFMSWGLGASL